MATHEEVKKWIKVLVDRLNDMGPDICPDWGGSAQFVFPDLKTGWLVKMAMDGTVESWDEKIDEEAATGVLEMDSDSWVGYMTKKVSSSELRNRNKMKLRKSMDAIMRISPALM